MADVGGLDKFPPGSCTILNVEGRSVGVYNVRGQLFAVQNVCPHQLAPICLGDLTGTMVPSAPDEYIYDLEGYVLRCFRHGWEFDIRTGRALFEVDRRRLKTYPVRVDGDRVVVVVKTGDG